MVLNFEAVEREKTENLVYIIQNSQYLKKKYPRHCTDGYLAAAAEELKKRHVEPQSAGTDSRRLVTEEGAKWYAIILFIHSGIWALIVLAQVYSALMGNQSLYLTAAVNIGLTIWNIYIGVQYFGKKTLLLSYSLGFIVFGLVWYAVQIALGNAFMLIPLAVLVVGIIIVLSHLQPKEN